MDANRIKELKQQWKQRHPQMGVIAIQCEETGELFVGVSKDIPAEFNRHRFQLAAGLHPNKRMQEMWRQHGKECLTFGIARELDYEDPLKDHADELQELLDEVMAEHPEAQPIVQ